MQQLIVALPLCFSLVFIQLALLPFPAQSFSFMSVLDPKRVLITGANKGIGKAITQKLLESHPDVVVFLGSRDRERGEATVKELESCAPEKDRIHLVETDTTDKISVGNAAAKVASLCTDSKLYGIINNAGIGFGCGFEKTLETNYWGPPNVCDAFASILLRPGGRVVNIASAGGPNFVNRCSIPDLKKRLAKPLTGTLAELDSVAKSYKDQTDFEDSAYGLSKALLDACTVIYAKQNPDLIVNSCSPGYILTDLTRGRGATNPPEKGTVSPIHLLLSPEMEKLPTGRYYGSDAVRGPLDIYRGPGEPPYVDDDG